MDQRAPAYECLIADGKISQLTEVLSDGGVEGWWVRSVMQEPSKDGTFVGDVEPLDNLESLIARSGGDTSHKFRVVENGAAIGEIDMRDLVKAPVPRTSSGNRASSHF